MSNNLLIIGNGFDLHLNLESNFKSFFESELLDNIGKNYRSNKPSILYYLFYLRYFANGKYDYGSFRREDNTSPSWMDVEGFLKKIATEDKIFNHLFSAYKQSITGSRTYSINDPDVTSELCNIITAKKPPKSGADSVINKMLLDDLIGFENDFKNYLNEKILSRADYHESSDSFINKIYKQAVGGERHAPHTYVINFNYTEIQDPYYLSSNVHGTLSNNIVIGYDSTDNDSSKHIYELSKDWQQISASSNSFDVHQNKYNKIIFYGHSLGEQDYPYFFEIFDICNLLDSNFTTLCFCYSKFGTEEEQKAFLNNYQIKISKLLNFYERFKKGSDNRNTVVTKLKSQNRLQFLLIKDN